MHTTRWSKRCTAAGTRSRASTSTCLRALLALLLSATLAPSHAQSSVTGAWDGPWDWTAQIYGGAPPPAGYACGGEISHAALLPTGPYRGKILLWRYDSMYTGGSCTTNHTTSQAFLFDPAMQGSNPKLIRINQALQSDIFCCGLSWDPDGELIVVGGVGPTPNDLQETYRFRPAYLGQLMWGVGTGWPTVVYDPATPPWLKIGDMSVKHYYPTAFHLNKRAAFYSAQPSGTCGTSVPGSSCMVFGGPGEDPYNGAGVKGNEVWDVLPPAGTAWQCPLLPTSGLINPWTVNDYDPYDIVHTPSAPPTEVLLDSYPRMFQLTNGELFIAVDVNSVEYTTHPVTVLNRPGHTWVVKPRFNTALQARWELHKGTSPATELVDPSNDRFYAPAILMHMRPPSGVQDRVLVFGGSMDANHFGANPDGSMPSWVVLDSVQEYQHSATTWWSKPSMQQPRTVHNAVMLPTGEVLLVGGSSTDKYHGQPAAPIFRPELYNPGVAPLDNPTPSGVLLAESNMASSPQARNPRLYHHVAVLMEDGRVFVAGGEALIISGGSPAQIDPNYPNPQFSGELYSPPYLFQGFRPVIRNLLPPNQVAFSTGGTTQTFQFQATVKSGNQPDGVVLLRPAALTHHFDNDQRYIELQHTTQLVQQTATTDAYTFTVNAPLDDRGPAGWYMLFVIEKDPSTGARVPSVAHHIRLF